MKIRSEEQRARDAECKRRYRKSPLGIEAFKRAATKRKTPSGREYERSLRSMPDIKESRREYARKYNLLSRVREAARLRREALKETPEGRFSYYKRNSKNRGVHFEITIEQFSEFWKKPCVYCGAAIKTIGIDRVDNSIGYVQSNLAACCYTCNFMKRGWTKEFFVEHCRKIADFASNPFA